MKIYKIKSYEEKVEQQTWMVLYCINHWHKLNDAKYSNYPDVLNMKTNRVNVGHKYYVAETYHFKPKKW